MTKIKGYTEFISEKKSPYKKATLLKYKRKWEAGEEIPFGIEASLKAQGMIPRADGETRTSPEYTDTVDKIKDVLMPKKNLKESFEDTIGTAEVTLEFTDKNGKSVEVKEVEGSGMAGEPMTFAYLFHDNKLTTQEKLKTLMKSQDYKELVDYLSDVYDNNYASAVSYVK
jgi:hypothetical protein